MKMSTKKSRVIVPIRKGSFKSSPRVGVLVAVPTQDPQMWGIYYSRLHPSERRPQPSKGVDIAEGTLRRRLQEGLSVPVVRLQKFRQVSPTRLEVVEAFLRAYEAGGLQGQFKMHQGTLVPIEDCQASFISAVRDTAEVIEKIDNHPMYRVQESFDKLMHQVTLLGTQLEANLVWKTHIKGLQEEVNNKLKDLKHRVRQEHYGVPNPKPREERPESSIELRYPAAREVAFSNPYEYPPAKHS